VPREGFFIFCRLSPKNDDFFFFKIF